MSSGDATATLYTGTPATVHVKIHCATLTPDWPAVCALWQKIYSLPEARQFWFVVDIREVGLAFTVTNLLSIFNLLQEYRERSDKQVVATILICNKTVQLPIINCVTKIYTPTRPLDFVATDAEAHARTGCGHVHKIL